MSKNMYQNLSCPLSNGTTTINLLDVLMTDFRNFCDEEHFSTELHQNQLFGNSVSSLSDNVCDDYSRHTPADYTDNSIILEQDVKREFNDDLAIISMSSEMDSCPKLSSLPPAKDFHKIHCDCLAPIEVTPPEDNSLVIDMLDYFTPNIHVVPLKISEPCTINTVLPDFDFSQNKSPNTEPNFCCTRPILVKTEQAAITVAPEAPKIVQKTGGKNLELMKQVMKKQIDLDITFKSEITSSEELEVLNDNFDIINYINEHNNFEKVHGKTERVKKFGGCYEKNMHLGEELEEKEENDSEAEVMVEKHRDLKENNITNINVETVSEQIPVVQICDVNLCWKQFEANIAVRPQSPQNSFIEVQPISSPSPSKLKQINPELKQPTKANISKPLTFVIPAIPNETQGSFSNHCTTNNLALKANNDYIQMDQVYYNSSGATAPSFRKSATTESSEHLLDISNEGTNNRENAMSKQPTVKNLDGKVMISLLKPNFQKSNNSCSKSPTPVKEKTQQMCKKRKLNLEEYKYLRGNLKTKLNTHSTNDLPKHSSKLTNKEYQELITKMSSELLKTSAKSKDEKETDSKRTTLEEFVPPDAKKPVATV